MVELAKHVCVRLEPSAWTCMDPESPSPASPNLICSESLRTKERHRKAQFYILGGTAACSPDVASHSSPSLKCSASDHTWAQTQLAAGHVINPHLQPIKSPCFSMEVRILWSRTLGLENLSKNCFAQINLLLYFFNLA